MAKCKLNSWTVPQIEGITSMQEYIAYCARVSNPSNQLNNETSENLIKYLIKHKHWSPFEMAHACIEIETTRDISHQIIRHRSFSFQEFSQRYADPLSSLGAVKKEARLQDHKNRQNSIKNDSLVLDKKFEKMQEEVIRVATNYYYEAIQEGIAKEVARVLLPEGLTLSRLYMSGNIRSWIHYIQLRAANGTQKEHMDVAIGCMKELQTIFPLIQELVNVWDDSKQ